MSPRSRRIFEPIQPALLSALRAQLAEGERLAWAGSPELSAFERAEEEGGVGKLDALMILGGGYATIGSGVMAVRTGHWLWLSVPPALLVLAGAVYFVVRWFRERARKAVQGTAYGLTTKRALLIHTYPKLNVQALEIGAITDVVIRDEQDEIGDLILHESMVFRAVAEPGRSRSQLMRVIRDPAGAEQEIMVAEQYAMQMKQLMIRSGGPR